MAQQPAVFVYLTRRLRRGQSLEGCVWMHHPNALYGPVEVTSVREFRPGAMRPREPDHDEIGWRFHGSRWRLYTVNHMRVPGRDGMVAVDPVICVAPPGLRGRLWMLFRGPDRHV